MRAIRDRSRLGPKLAFSILGDKFIGFCFQRLPMLNISRKGELGVVILAILLNKYTAIHYDSY